MRQLLLFIVFAAAFAAVGYVAVTPVDLAYIGAASGAPVRVEQALQTASEEALTARDLDWAQVELDGQIAVLRGEAPREEERAQALNAVRTAAGGGGPASRGVMAVRDLITIAPPVSPYEWSAVRAGGRVTLVGAVPTRAAKAGLAAYAGELFPGGVANQMVIARGAPDEAAWVTVARTALSQLSVLEDGRATLKDERLTIEGLANNAVARDRVTAALALLPAPFLAAARVEASADGMVAESLVREAEALEPIVDLAVCRDVFVSLIDGEQIDFSANGSAIAKESYPLLDRLAIAAMRCEAARLTIVGRGEADVAPGPDAPSDAGDDVADAYAALGAGRARAVADYFVLKGVAQDRLVTDAGDAPSEGEAQTNIEFVINS